MKSCLKSYHGSTFDGRKINCELTAGGGGNNENRQSKLREKNQRLKAERKRRVEHEEKEKQRNSGKPRDAATGANASEKSEPGALGLDGAVDRDQNDGVHPSRRSRIKM